MRRSNQPFSHYFNLSKNWLLAYVNNIDLTDSITEDLVIFYYKEKGDYKQQSCAYHGKQGAKIHKRGDFY